MNKTEKDLQHENDMLKTETDKDCTNEQTYFELRKGFKGRWWNLVNYGKLSKADRKKVTIQLIIGGIAVMVAIIALVLIGNSVNSAIKNNKSYSQIEVGDFRKSWNLAAQEDPDGITNGVEIKKKDIKDSLNSISLPDGHLSIQRSGKDIKQLKYTSGGYSSAKNHDEIISELLSFCIPDIDYTDAVKEYVMYESEYVQNGINGFEITFFEANKRNEIDYHIKMEYDYSSNIVAANTKSGCAFKYTINDFIENYNDYLDNAVDNISHDSYYKGMEQSQLESLDNFAKTWKIGSVDYVKFERTEVYDDTVIDVYLCSLNYLGIERAAIGFYVERESGKIVELAYTLGCDYCERLASEKQYFVECSLTEFIYASIGFSPSLVYEDYFVAASKNEDHTIIKQGVSAQAGIKCVGSTYMYYHMVYALGDEKNIGASEDDSTANSSGEETFTNNTES